MKIIILQAFYPKFTVTTYCDPTEFSDILISYVSVKDKNKEILASHNLTFVDNVATVTLSTDEQSLFTTGIYAATAKALDNAGVAIITSTHTFEVK